MALVFEFSSQQRIKEEYRQMPTAEVWSYLLELSKAHQFGERGISEMTTDLKWNGEALIQYQEWPSFIQTMLICLILGDKHFHVIYSTLSTEF